MLRKFCMVLGLSLLPANFEVAVAQSAPPAPSEPKIAARQIAPAAAPSTIAIVSKAEPGEPMVIAGRVTDGRTPIKNASVFVYHTDAEGYYANHRFDNGDEARLHGAMRTDASGRYEYRTIRPRSYPNTTFPAHVHYVVHADGYRDVFTEFNFEDDPFVTAKIREFNATHKRGIVKLTQDDRGVWHGAFDLVLTRSERP
ncbi:MAG: dioxygenase family protein [Rhodospirillaceae bacterium]